MKKKYIIILGIVLVIIIAILLAVFLNKKELDYPDDENTLYSIKFDNIKLRFERYDYVLGQNQLVGVEKTTNKGKNYEKLTDEPIIVSMEPKFIFINEKLGFAISKPNLTKSNNYIGVKVTQDGGKTFTDGKINYNNPNIDILTIEDVPYVEKDLLKLPCSIYQVKADHSGYEDVKLIFSSSDNGLTWNIEDETIDNNEEHHFKAKVIEVSNGYIIVEPNEDEEERKSSDRFHIDNKNNVSYKEGQILAITYIGGINESYPAQIGVTNISIIESN